MESSIAGFSSSVASFGSSHRYGQSATAGRSWSGSQAIAASARRGTAKDADAIADLVNQAYEAERFFVDGDRTSTTEISQLLNQGEFLLIDGHFGLAGAVFMQAPATAVSSDADTCLISMLAVSPHLQRGGIGSRLLGTAEALAAALGCHTSTLHVVNVREDLVRWYKAAGYRIDGSKPFVHRPTKQPCHLLTFSKSIRFADQW
jgi:GNAT superfamily N-acetyltransferase